MKLVDSHCHLNTLDLTQFNNTFDEVLAQAKAASVAHCLTVCVELEEYDDLCRMADTYDNISISIGLHPNSVVKNEPSSAYLIEKAKHPKCIAIGETGLDYYRVEEAASQTQQRQRFINHIEAAITTKKPLIIHTRQAAKDTIAVMKDHQAELACGVMHCFSEDWDIATAAMDLGFYISLSGIVTFKNATMLQDIAKRLPIDRILIETDAPYLAPMPFRGKQNHPALVAHTAKYIADLRNVSIETIADATTQNFSKLFGVVL